MLCQAVSVAPDTVTFEQTTTEGKTGTVGTMSLESFIYVCSILSRNAKNAPGRLLLIHHLPTLCVSVVNTFTLTWARATHLLGLLFIDHTY